MTTTDVRLAWERVAETIESLGLKLSLHVEQEFLDEPSGSRPVIGRTIEAVEDLADAVAHAASDPAIREDVVALGERLLNGIVASANEARSHIPQT